MPNPFPRRGTNRRPYLGAPPRTRPHHARRNNSPPPPRSARAAAPRRLRAQCEPGHPSRPGPSVAVRVDGQITTALSSHGARIGLLTSHPESAPLTGLPLHRIAHEDVLVFRAPKT